MTKLSKSLIAAISAIHEADAHDLAIAAKAILQGDATDAADVAMDMLAREARERIEYADNQDPILDDVLAISAAYFNPSPAV